MKRMKRLLTLCLVLCLSLTMMPTAHAYTFTSQEQSWLTYLRPRLPKTQGDTSHPARLVISFPETESVTLHGNCSRGGELNDEQILDALKRACSSVEGYKNPQDALNDRVLANAVKEKLKFTEEDMDQLIENWINLLGMDKVASFIRSEFPSYGNSDGVSVITDIILSRGDFGLQEGLSSLSPVPLNLAGFAQGVIINGAFVTWEEFHKDKEKYKDITAMAQANARLRAYYVRVNELLRQAMSDSTAWHIRINDRQEATSTFRAYSAVTKLAGETHPMFFFADIDLIKDDGSYGNINGTYTGRFLLSVEGDLAAMESNHHNMLAEGMNIEAADDPFRALNPDPERCFGVSTTINKPAEFRMVLERPDTAVTLSLPAGVNRTIFELPITATELEQTELINTCDNVVVVEGRTSDYVDTHTYTLIANTTDSYDHHYQRHVESDGHVGEATNVYNHVLPTDFRPYMTITLVVDML